MGVDLLLDNVPRSLPPVPLSTVRSIPATAPRLTDGVDARRRHQRRRRRWRRRRVGVGVGVGVSVSVGRGCCLCAPGVAMRHIDIRASFVLSHDPWSVIGDAARMNEHHHES